MNALSIIGIIQNRNITFEQKYPHK